MAIIISECYEHKLCPKAKGSSSQWQADNPKWLAQWPEFVQAVYQVALTGKQGATGIGIKLLQLQLAKGGTATSLAKMANELQRHLYDLACKKWLTYVKRYLAKYRAAGRTLESLQPPPFGSKEAPGEAVFFF